MYVNVATPYHDVQIGAASFIVEVDLEAFGVQPPVVRDVLKVDLVFYPIVQPFRLCVLLVGNDSSVLDPDDPVRVEVGQLFLVGDQDDQPFLRDGLDDVHDLQSIAAVQVSRRLVGDDDGRVLDDGPGDADSLPLTAGQHVCVPVPVAVHADLLKDIVDPGPDLLLVLHSDHLQGHRHIVKDGHAVDQIVVLEDIAYVQGTDLVHLPRGPAGDPLAVDVDLALVDLIQSSDGVQKGRLAAAGWPQQGDQPLPLQVEGRIVDGVYFVLSSAEEVFVDML